MSFSDPSEPSYPPPGQGDQLLGSIPTQSDSTCNSDPSSAWRAGQEPGPSHGSQYLSEIRQLHEIMCEVQQHIGELKRDFHDFRNQIKRKRYLKQANASRPLSITTRRKMRNACCGKRKSSLRAIPSTGTPDIQS
ncbi:hypothetical protein FOMG_17585 [Fusarium oxysporum f. sp. melonis 26406]|uniref:Uncharacterized protein n=1 Tax=Fusarium oxysporum f. sp. melonis 26406 TaxID=1089452 RepID=W9Z1U7_FUSOX|nr:hypothetical protein FOMG_17585 [Fusarium oxysporum f. sp. melonis 26406]